jgi:FMN phosphatase YigB (HAD superfamily)
VKISAVCFDLGKVLLHFDWQIMLARVAEKSPLSTAEISDLMSGDPLNLSYETGAITSARFFSHLKSGCVTRARGRNCGRRSRRSLRR